MPSQNQDLLTILQANLKPSTNINQAGCQLRLTTSYVFLFLAIPFHLIGKTFTTKSSDLSCKFFPWFPISFLYSSAVSSFLESQLQICIVVTYLDTTSTASHQIKTFAILFITTLTQFATYYMLGKNEAGRWFPFLPTTWTSSVWCYVPNLIGYVRLLLLGLGLFFIADVPLLFVACWIISGSLDFFDGYMARKLKQTSKFGELLDVICDNVSRTIMWICAANVNATLIPLSVFVVVLEWMTFVCTQLDTMSSNINKNVNWKEMSKKEKKNSAEQKMEIDDVNVEEEEKEAALPFMIVYFFSNNFVNPLGMLGILGLFGCPLYMYICNSDVLNSVTDDEDNKWIKGVGYVLCLGRVVCGTIEMYFIAKYLKKVVKVDERNRRMEGDALKEE